MTHAILFWVLMLCWLIFGLWLDYLPGHPYPLRSIVRSVLTFVLLAILGWSVFGAPVKG